MSKIICTHCNHLLATHALCNQDAEPTDWNGEVVFKPTFVFCDQCSNKFANENDAEICSVCETFDSTKVRINGVEFKPLYLPDTLDNEGMCRDHP